jgi:hypothetical protein
MFEYLSFDRFITPSIIRVVFVLGLLLLALVTLVRVVFGLWALRIWGGVIVPLIAMCAFAVLWRIYCELILVFFDMREKLTTIADRSTTTP